MNKVEKFETSSKLVIVLASYHPEPLFFEKQIQSIQDQTRQDWVCIVSDDSIDPHAVQFIQTSLSSDPRFFYIQNSLKPGVVGNFENALANIPEQSEVIFFCDQDDVWHSDKIEKIVHYFENHPEISVVHSDLRQVDFEGIPLNSSVWSLEERHLLPTSLFEMLLHPSVTGCSMAVRKTFLNKVLPFPRGQDAEKILHDHWISLIAYLEKTLGLMNQALIDYRQHGKNVVGTRAASSGVLDWNKMRKFKLNLMLLPSWEKHVLANQLLQRSSQIAFTKEDRHCLLIFSQCRPFQFLFTLVNSPFFQMKNASLYFRIFLGLILRPWKKEEP